MMMVSVITRSSVIQILILVWFVDYFAICVASEKYGILFVRFGWDLEWQFALH